MALIIGFLTNKLTLRGTELTMYDYANYNETYLNNKSIIITRPYDHVKIYSPMDVTTKAYEKFINRFSVYYYINRDDIYEIVDKYNIDVLVIEKAGSMNDGLVFDFSKRKKHAKTIIRCVFTTREPHGDLFTTHSEFINYMDNTNYPVTPIIVQVDDDTSNLRQELNIPDDAIVFGNMGGADTFNIEYVKNVVRDVTQSPISRNIYFIFLNMNKFIENKFAIFLEGTYDMKYKRKFINTCDAMYYGRDGRDGGETFGLACGEFSLCKKVIVGRSGEQCNNHELLLKNNMIKHSNYEECFNIVVDPDFKNKYKYVENDNGYNKYTMNYAMNLFKLYLNMVMSKTSLSLVSTSSLVSESSLVSTSSLYYSQCEQDKYLEENIFKSYRNGIFVDVGAHDGKWINNTLFFEQTHNWTGINIEPLDTVYKNLIINRSKCININCAISENEGTYKFYSNNGYTETLSGLVDYYDDRHNNRLYRENSEYNSHTNIIDVKTRSLKNIFEEYKINHVPYLSIDVEGGEYSVVKSIDFNKVYIDVIGFENNYNDISEPIVNYLYGKGYEISKYYTDIIMIHKNSIFNNVLKVFFNGWFDGFLSDPPNQGLTHKFFIDLFKRIFNTHNIEIGNISNSQILCEFDMMINTSTKIDSSKWKKTFLFSGESKLLQNPKLYDCVLWNRRNNNNIINVPLFIPYIYTNNFVERLEIIEIKKQMNNVPSKDVICIITNPNGIIRNKFLEKLEKVINIDYAGFYKRNIENIKHPYNSDEFLNIIKNYRFVIAMENSFEDTYITEKIIHGLLAGIIPIYWGTNKISSYINDKRILRLPQDCTETDMNNLISNIIDIKNNENKWKSIVNANIFPNDNNKLTRTIDDIVQDIKCVIQPSDVDKIFFICNKEYEPERHTKLIKEFSKINFENSFKFISPTYKHTITPEMYNYYVKEQTVLQIRNNPMKYSELSLFLNYKATLQYIVDNYSDGIFITFESDVLPSKDIELLNDFLNFIASIKDKWDLIHIGQYDNQMFESPLPYFATGYNDRINYGDKYIEDITGVNSKFRLIRKFHTRCTDSFVWTYIGVQKFLNYMTHINLNYGVPFDYYMCNYFEHNNKFKHYWSVNEFFIQGSNNGFMKSTIK